MVSSGQRRCPDPEDGRRTGRAHGPSGRFHYAGYVSHHSVSDLSRNPALHQCRGAPFGADYGGSARCHPYCNRRPAGHRRTEMVPEAGFPVHHGLSHPFSRVCACPVQNSGGLVLGGAAVVPRTVERDNGCDAEASARARGPGAAQHENVDPRCRSGAVPAATKEPVCRPRRAGFYVCRPGGD